MACWFGLRLSQRDRPLTESSVVAGRAARHLEASGGRSPAGDTARTSDGSEALALFVKELEALDCTPRFVLTDGGTQADPIHGLKPKWLKSQWPEDPDPMNGEYAEHWLIAGRS